MAKLIRFTTRILGLALVANATSAFSADRPLIEFTQEGRVEPTPTGMRAPNGEPLYAIPAIVLTDKYGKQAIVPVDAESTDEPPPGEWRDVGFGTGVFPGAQISTTEWISASATVVFGTLSYRPIDPQTPWLAQEYRYRGPSAQGELGYRTFQVGLGYTEARFITILWIIPLPYAVSWGVHAMFLHANDDGRGLTAGEDYLGIEGKFSIQLVRFSLGVYRQLHADHLAGRRYMLRAGIGIGF